METIEYLFLGLVFVVFVAMLTKPGSEIEIFGIGWAGTRTRRKDVGDEE